MILPDDIRLITIETDKDREDILIRIPVDLLKFSQSRRDNPIHIVDNNKMVDDFIENFLEFKEADYSEFGKFYELLDSWFVDRLEFDCDYLETEEG